MGIYSFQFSCTSNQNATVFAQRSPERFFGLKKHNGVVVSPSVYLFFLSSEAKSLYFNFRFRSTTLNVCRCSFICVNISDQLKTKTNMLVFRIILINRNHRGKRCNGADDESISVIWSGHNRRIMNSMIWPLDAAAGKQWEMWMWRRGGRRRPFVCVSWFLLLPWRRIDEMLWYRRVFYFTEFLIEVRVNRNGKIKPQMLWGKYGN